MGVDCRIYLSSRANVRDVATAIAILLGQKVEKRPLGSDGWHVVVDGVKVYGIENLPECCHIKVAERWFLFHFEFGRGSGQRGIMPRSTPSNIALCKRLADFFGGTVAYNDCDSNRADYFVEERFDILGEDDEAFYRKQERFLKIVPLTKGEIAECVRHSAYKEAA